MCCKTGRALPSAQLRRNRRWWLVFSLPSLPFISLSLHPSVSPSVRLPPGRHRAPVQHTRNPTFHHSSSPPVHKPSTAPLQISRSPAVHPTVIPLLHSVSSPTLHSISHYSIVSSSEHQSRQPASRLSIHHPVSPSLRLRHFTLRQAVSPTLTHYPTPSLADLQTQ